VNATTFEKSDITATSQLGAQGQVAIDDANVPLTQDTIELSTDLIDTSHQIAQVCSRGSVERGRFVVSGRGSVPPSLIDSLAEIGIMSALATLEGQPPSVVEPSKPGPSSKLVAQTLPSNTIIEAQGWSKTRNGKVILVAGANAPEVSTQAKCPTDSH
jgi:large exoprotein involved in heme utilization and adhesion